MTSEVGAGVDGGDDGTVQVSAFKAEETGECNDVESEWGISLAGRTRPGFAIVENPLT